MILNKNPLVLKIRKWNPGLASASVMVVIELIKVVPINTSPSSPIECSSLILKSVKVLSSKRNKLFEIWVRFGTGLKVFDDPIEILSSGWQQRALRILKVVPIETVEPRMPHNLSKSILEFWASIRTTTNARFGPGEQARQKINTFCGKLRPNLSRDLKCLPPFQNLSACCHWIICIERGVPHKTLVHDHTQTPPIHCTRV
mmetsp:Transcript_13529/g.21291  ORF Transcript_13529/g.21291 Transcript_13529/m.21291 type:complete len:201 (+) Transcript_13529:85-687(+)